MAKTHTTISIDNDVLKAAQENNLNVSAESERALRNRLSNKNTSIPEEDGDKCDFCGKIQKKATRDDLDGLTWICPDEKWICSDCLDRKVRLVKIGLRYL